MSWLIFGTDKTAIMTKKGKQKWGWFLVVWLVLFILIKSVEKILYITLVFGAVYFFSKYWRSLKNGGEKQNKKGKIRRTESYESK